MKLAALLLLLFALPVRADNHLVSPEFLDVTTGSGYVCAILKATNAEGRNSLECWGNLQWEMSQPIKLENPESFATGTGKFCVIGGGEMECATWMGNERFSGVQIAAAGAKDYYCFVGGEGLKCRVTLRGRSEFFKGDLLSPLAGVTNPQQLAVGLGMGCVLETGIVRCWEHDQQSPKVAVVPELRNPREIAATGSYVCAVDDTGLICWGGEYKYEVWTGTELQLNHPHSLATASGQTCLIDGGQLKCWSRGYYGATAPFVPQAANQPALKNPRIHHLSGHSCAVDDDGIHCWSADKKYVGENFMPLKKFGIPTSTDLEFNLDKLPRFLETASELLNPARRQLFLKFAALSLREFPTPVRSMRASYGRLLIAKLALAVVRSSDSQVAQGKLKNALESSLKGFEKELDSSGPALAYQPLVSLSMMHLVVEAMKDFIAPGEATGLSDLIRAIGQAMASPSEENTRGAIAEISAQQDLLQKIALNSRCNFLVAALGEAARQLGRK